MFLHLKNKKKCKNIKQFLEIKKERNFYIPLQYRLVLDVIHFEPGD